jgi:hypothetical protein
MKKLSEKFKDEREAICDKIIGILELNNGEFILCELDENIEKPQRLGGSALPPLPPHAFVEKILAIDLHKHGGVRGEARFPPNNNIL